MAAAASLLETPPYVAPAALVVVRPDDEIARRVSEAERLVAANRHDAAVAQLEDVWPHAQREPELALRFRLTLSWAEMYRGRLERAAELLAQADGIVSSPRFDASDRAEVLYRQGCVALKQSDVAGASSLFTRALETNERSARPSRSLEARAYEWRARCHVLRRDWNAARRDAERSLEIATATGEELLQAHALFQASLVAERQRQWLLARCYAEQALAIYTAHGDGLSTARILNNLGCLHFLLGEVDTAEQTLLAASGAAAEAGSDPDVAQARSSLAQVYLRTGRSGAARASAEAAAELLAERPDFLDELGNAQLVVAKALAADRDRAGAQAWLDRAEASFTALGSASHLAATWVARGDLARAHGDCETAAALYRRSAEALQDLHF